MSEEGKPGRSAGRPRDEGFDEVILQQARREISEAGIAGFNLSAVARRAGVAKNSIYLRWPHRFDLIKAALMHGRQPNPPPLVGDLGKDLRSLADEYAASFAAAGGLVNYYQMSITSMTEPEMWEWAMEHIVSPAHAYPERLIAEAQERGQVRTDVPAGVAARMYVGGIYAEAILRTPHGHVSKVFLDQLVEQTMRVLERD